MSQDTPGMTVLKIGVVMRPHGLRGSFTVKPLSPGPPPSFLTRILLQPQASAETITCRVKSWRFLASGHWIVDAEDFTIERVQTVRNALVMAFAEDYGELAPDEVWLETLMGAEAVYPDGVSRGCIIGVLETPAPYPTLVVRDPDGQERYLPLPREHFISFDADRRVLVVSTPDS